jgi:hypothetical protein
MNNEPFTGEIIKLFLKMIAGVAGGLLGTSVSLLTMIGIMYSNKAIGSSLESTQFSGMSLVILIFAAAFIANLTSLYFIILTNKKKYKFKGYIMKGAFFLNIFLFIVALPFYLIVPTGGDFVLTIAGIHLFLSASSSALFAEIFSGVEYALTGVIGISIAQMVLLLSYIGLGAPTSNTIVTVLFLPFIWMMLPLFHFFI